MFAQRDHATICKAPGSQGHPRFHKRSMAADGAPATPSAFYKMLAVPEAQELILSETQELPAVEVRFQDALHHTLAAEVRAVEPVPGFRASIKVRAENHCLPP